MGLINDFKAIRDYVAEERGKQYLTESFKAMTVYAPTFSTFTGGVYEMDLTRASIRAIANHVSKANPVVVGEIYRSLEKTLQNRPNGLMTCQQFLAKLTTILIAENTCFIVPLYEDRSYAKIVGLHPVSSKGSKIVRNNGKDYLEYRLEEGGQFETKNIELARVGILREHYYRSDYYGDSNDPLNPILNVLDVQNQGIIEAVKSSATLRFMMKIANVVATPTKIKEVRDRVKNLNLSSENNGGIFMYDGTFENAQQIDSKPFIVDSLQTETIKRSVLNYFGVSEPILQNTYTEEQFNAFYEGRIEPILIQLSGVISNMLFNERELTKGSMVVYESSRLQYASNTTKLNIVTQLVDRGLMSLNQGLSIFNLPPIEDGDKRYIRREYVEVAKLDMEINEGKEKENDE